MGSSLLRLLTLYAIWGKGAAAASLRATGKAFFGLGIQFMVCFWVWTLSPLVMTFAIPVVYVTYLYLEKAYRVSKGQREEAERCERIERETRRQFAEADNDLPKTQEEWSAWNEQQIALRQQDARRIAGIDPRTGLPSKKSRNNRELS